MMHRRPHPFFGAFFLMTAIFALAISAGCGDSDADSDSDTEPEAAADSGTGTPEEADAAGDTESPDAAADASEVQPDAGDTEDAGGGADASVNEPCVQADQYCNEDDNGGMRCKNGQWIPWTCQAGTTCSRRDDGWLSCVETSSADEPAAFGFGTLTCTTRDTYTIPGSTYKLRRCITKVGGVEMKVFGPAKVTGKPLTLAIYLHGDGARPYTGNSAVRYQGPWAVQQSDLLYVIARAPNGCSWWRAPSPVYGNCDDASGYTSTNPQDTSGKNADALKQAIDALRSAMDISTEQTLFAGSSGGSIMLTASWIPKYGNLYPGAYVLECGGEAPWTDFSWNEEGAADAIQDMTFVYGSGERLLSEIQDAYEFYGNELDVNAWLVEAENADTTQNHCNYSHIADVTERWGQVYP